MTEETLLVFLATAAKDRRSSSSNVTTSSFFSATGSSTFSLKLLFCSLSELGSEWNWDTNLHGAFGLTLGHALFPGPSEQFSVKVSMPQTGIFSSYMDVLRPVF